MSTTVSEIDDYVTAVHAALADLPDDEREDLLDDLPQHLADVQADRGGSLVDLLGTPQDYAAELRATAGLAATPDTSSWRVSVLDRLTRTDERLGAALGYARFADLVRALAPAWWIIRGWLVAEFVTAATGRSGRRALLPAIGGNWVAGIGLLLVAVTASVWFGRRARPQNWQRTAVAVLGLALAVYGVALARHALAPMTYHVEDSGNVDGTSGVTNVFPVGPDGSVLKNVRLYDQNGAPLQLGSTCPDLSYSGDPTDGAAPASTAATSAASSDGAAVYPLTCDSGQGPHAPALPSDSASTSDSPSAPVPSSPAVVSSTPATPTASASR